eukprot:snap_masked-scaffold_135-processed-gene-0.3-mRNA-1 protein AED:0.12 eAED:0.30 QI:0/0/0/0.75/1/1/4/0/235
MHFSHEQLQELYIWIDKITLSRPKRNISRDFSDGILAAEVVHFFEPKLVQLHNYSPANRRVFQKLGFILSKEEIKDVVSCKSMAIEKILFALKERIINYKSSYLAQKQIQNTRKGNLSFNLEFSSLGLPFQEINQNITPRTLLNKTKINQFDNIEEEEEINQAMFGDEYKIEKNIKEAEEKEKDKSKDLIIKRLQETINILHEKVQKLEQLVYIKDSRIKALQKNSKEMYPNLVI